jgi:hypothetical protein
MRVCQFRHDGNLNCKAAAAQRPPCQEDQHCYFTGRLQPVKPQLWLRTPKPETRSPTRPYPSFAVIEILAFSTFDTGQPFSAASAYF